MEKASARAENPSSVSETRLRAWLHGEFHPGLTFQTGFWSKSPENQIVDYMERDSARGAIQSGLKILARYSQTGLGFHVIETEFQHLCFRTSVNFLSEFCVLRPP